MGKPKLQLVLILLATALAGWVVGLGAYPLLLWSELNCFDLEVDLNSGRLRRKRYLLSLPVRETVIETEFSCYACPDGTRAGPRWVMDARLSPMVRQSFHYVYHGASATIKLAEMIWQLHRFSEEAKRKMARDIVWLWNNCGHAGPAIRYCNAVEQIALRLGGRRRLVPADLPDPASFCTGQGKRQAPRANRSLAGN